MPAASRMFLIGAVAILIVDTAGAFGSLILGFPYAALTPISLGIFAMTGYFATRAATLRAGILAATGVAVVEATIGWAVSWTIGPGRPPDGYQSLALLVTVVVVMAIIGAVSGLIGAGIARLVARRPAARKPLRPSGGAR